MPNKSSPTNGKGNNTPVHIGGETSCSMGGDSSVDKTFHTELNGPVTIQNNYLSYVIVILFDHTGPPHI